MCARVKPDWDCAGNVGDIHSGAYGGHATAYSAGVWPHAIVKLRHLTLCEVGIHAADHESSG